MRLTLIFSFLALSLQAQDPSGEEAIAKVFAVLSGEETKLPLLEERNPLLQNGAWEALAYIDRSQVLMPSAEDLMEAVPDYYHFKKDYFLFKLINPKNHNQYGIEGQLKYRWEKKDLVVLSTDGKQEKDRWTLLYLDENYLALKMGDLHVFLQKLGRSSLDLLILDFVKTMTADRQNLEIAKLQKDIESYLSLGSTQMIFDYRETNRGIRLDVITVNPRHNQSFLFHHTIGYDRIDALKQMHAYIKEHYEKQNSYTVQWSAKGQNELHTSYFRAKDIPEAIDKLNFSRDPNSITIFSVVLNPIS